MPIETLKVQNIDQMAILVYNYLRYKFLLKHNFNKDWLHKAFENLSNVLLNYLAKRGILQFSDEVLWSFINDYTELHAKSLETVQDLSEIEEKIESIGSEIDEETNINGLLGMENIERVDHKEFTIGTLFNIFKFKAECLKSQNPKDVFDSYKNLFKSSNIAYWKARAPLLYVEYDILSSIKCYLSNDTVYAASNLLNLHKYVKMYRKFKKSHFVNECFPLFENMIKQLLSVFVASTGLRLNEHIKNFLNLNNELVANLNGGETNFEVILSPNVLTYLKGCNLLSVLQNAFTKKEKSTQLSEDVLRLFYANSLIHYDSTKGEDLFALKKDTNKQFGNLYSILNKN